MNESTARFLELMEKQNRLVASLQTSPEVPQPDEIRLQREQERREKWGQLRAREHTSRRPRQAKRVFDYIDLSH